MTFEYTYRQYSAGDAAAINSLYSVVTGRSRSLEQFNWQWLDAPGGKGDIWLIEAISENGERTLIGHHGVMPIRFSNGSEDVLFGKTENTMVRSEFRSRILYPRFERRFGAEYEKRYDALFSTFGPASAIRQRQAMGYSFSAKWVKLRIPTSWAGNLVFAYQVVLGRLGLRRGDDSNPADLKDRNFLSPTRTAPLRIRPLADSQARNDPFFDTFWPGCRGRYGLTPRRCRKDLDWRFWSNPNKSHITLVSDENPGESGYIVLSFSTESSTVASIEDIVPEAPDSLRLGRLLDSTLTWLRRHGIKWVDFATTSDSCGDGKIADGLARRHLIVLQASARIRPAPVEFMPRKITQSGMQRQLDLDDWYVTPIVFEGI